MLKEIHADQLKKRPDVKAGDTVKMHLTINEGEKSRIQIFEGIVLAIKGSGMTQTITVRKISMGVGVEKIIPMHSPTLEKIEIVKRGDSVRQSRIYYMRDRIGRQAMKIKGAQQVSIITDEEAADVEGTVEEVKEEKAETVEEVKEEKKESKTKEASEKEA